MTAPAPEVKTPLLAQDHSAAPAPYRAADFGGRVGRLVVSEGLASDSYSLVPARAVSLGKTGTAADLELGVYEVTKLGATPVQVKDYAPNVAALIPDGPRVELSPFEVEGVGWVHTVTRDKDGNVETTLAIFTTPEGRHVAMNVDFLPTDGAKHDSESVNDWERGAVRWNLTAHDGDRPDLKPTVFTRRAYSWSTTRELYASGEWQAVIMPVRLGASSVRG